MCGISQIGQSKELFATEPTRARYLLLFAAIRQFQKSAAISQHMFFWHMEENIIKVEVGYDQRLTAWIGLYHRVNIDSIEDEIGQDNNCCFVSAEMVRR